MLAQSESSVRTRSYWFVDGLAELWVGSLFLILSGVELLDYLDTRDTVIWVFEFSWFLVFLAMSQSLRVLNALKLRITYPRTGYVEYDERRQEPWPRGSGVLLGVLFGVVLTAVVLFVTANERLVLSWGYLTIGAFWSAAFLFSWLDLRMYRFLVGATFLACACLLLWIFSVTGEVGWVVIWAVVALWELGAGGFTLYHYLKQNPITEQAYDEART